MSILSCEKLVSQYGNGIDIIENTHAIEINFQFAPKNEVPTSTSGTSMSVTLPAAYPPGQEIRVYGGAGGNFIANTHVSSSTSLWNSYFRVVGFKLFFKNGYLKCIKKEVSDAVTMTSADGVNEVQKLQHRNSFIAPQDMVPAIGNNPWMEVIEGKLLGLAKRKGVEVPSEFVCHGNKAHGYLGPNRHFTALDWLAYPLVRELNSVAFCRNLTHSDRGIIGPLNEAMNFKQLVEHYYGTSTPKMLSELWKSITFGNDIKKTVFAQDLVTGDVNLADLMARQDGILEMNSSYVTQIGDRALNPLIWGIGPPIFRTMGFDYFYKWVEHLPKQEVAVRVTDTFMYNHGVTQAYLELMLKHVSPKKLTTLLCGTITDWHYLPDIIRMMQDYPDANEIPLSLKGQFPNGLEINFKFKTMKELHDKISTQYTIIETEASKRDIPTHPLYLALNGRERNGLKLVVPTNTTFLALWGKLLSICVASYGDRAANCDTLILGVEKEGEIKYCIEFSPLIMDMMKPHDAIVGTLVDENSSPTMLETLTVRVALPKLEEKNAGVVPEGEEDTFLAPYFIQFRGHRNYDPEKSDKNYIESLLCEWVKECTEEYKKFGDKIYYRSDWGYGAFADNVLNNVVNRAGQPDQIFMNHHQMINLQRALGAQEAQFDVPPPPDNEIRIERRVVVDDAVADLQQEINPAEFNNYANIVVNQINNAMEQAIINVAPV